MGFTRRWALDRRRLGPVPRVGVLVFCDPGHRGFGPPRRGVHHRLLARHLPDVDLDERVDRQRGGRRR